MKPNFLCAVALLLAGCNSSPPPVSMFDTQRRIDLAEAQIDLAKNPIGRYQVAGRKQDAEGTDIFMLDTRSGRVCVSFVDAEEKLAPSMLCSEAPDQRDGKFLATFAFPSAVRGPVEQPPCHLHRRLPGTLKAVHGWPSRRRLPPHGTRIQAASWRCFAKYAAAHTGMGGSESLARARTWSQSRLTPP